MNLKLLKKNLTEIDIDNKRVLFSYRTPVAYYENGKFYKTTRYWSKTTSRHINSWQKDCYIAPHEAIEIDQSILDNLL